MQQKTLRPEQLMVMTRLANMALGVLSIPIMIHFLKAEAFASWALFLAFGNFFSMLELGMPPAIVKFIAFPIAQRDHENISRIVISVMLCLAVIFILSFVLIVALSGWLVTISHIPDPQHISARNLLLVVFLGAGFRSILQNTGLNLFYAAQRFEVISIVSLCQPFLSNSAAIVAAITTERLDTTVEAFWLTQVLVLGIVFLLAKRTFRWNLQSKFIRLATIKEVTAHGSRVQLSSFAEFVNFQFNKFLISGFIGLWGVAPYEVANRSVLALKSIPSSGLETFLPAASIRAAQGEDAWLKYIEMTKMAVYGVVIFMVAPLSVSFPFLYAWVGEMGYVSRWLFAGLILGAASQVICLPSATMVQAQGRSDIQAKAAALSVALNIPLSLLFMIFLETKGIVLGSTVAMTISSFFLIQRLHRSWGKQLSDCLRQMIRFWPSAAICLCWGAAATLWFTKWFSRLPLTDRFSRTHRLLPAIISVAIYLCCFLSITLYHRLRGDLDEEMRLFSPFEMMRRLAEKFRMQA